MKNNLTKYFCVLLFCSAQTIFAVNYVNLEAYKNYLPKSHPNSQSFRSILRNGWNEFKSNANEALISDNINSDPFWEMLRDAVEEGTFYNQITNLQISKKNTGGELFLKTLYSTIVQIPVIYKSVTPDGDTIWLSGKIFLPKNKKAKNIIIANHYTICADKEAPSNASSIEGILATKEYIVLMPDYLGYGVSRKWTHPYLHLKSTVTAAIDLLKAAIPYLKFNSYTFDSQLILLGYSQGAAATLALQKTLEEEYSTQFEIYKVYAGGGPYDLAGTYDFYISQATMNIPCAMPMLFLGMNYAEKLGLKNEDFFQPFLMQNYQSLIEEKNTSLNEVNAMLGKNIDFLFKPVIAQTDSTPASILYEAIIRNSILHWTPKSPMFVFHSTNDDMVPFLNSEHLKNEFDKRHVSRVQYDFAQYGNHMSAAVLFFEKVYKSL